MDRLTSCYFCGAALDAPLEEYPVVPRDLDPDDRARITLCPTCRRKLGGVVERVVEAADAGALEEHETDTDEPPSTEGSGADETVAGDATGDDPEVASSVDDESPGDEPGTASADHPTQVPDAGGSTPVVAGDEGANGGVSVLEYNRVMRLLENREFPVDRAEFVEIATRAYDVSRSDVDEIVAAAEEHGLLVVEDDQLVRPGE